MYEVSIDFCRQSAPKGRVPPAVSWWIFQWHRQLLLKLRCRITMTCQPFGSFYWFRWQRWHAGSNFEEHVRLHARPPVVFPFPLMVNLVYCNKVSPGPRVTARTKWVGVELKTADALLIKIQSVVCQLPRNLEKDRLLLLRRIEFAAHFATSKY